MAANRTKSIETVVEPLIYKKVMDTVPTLPMRTASSYIRSLIIRDMRDRGVLTDTEIAKMVAE